MHTPSLTPTRQTDRHDPSTVQLNARVPRNLRDAFYAACSAHDIIPSDALRSVLKAFVEHANAAEVHHD